MLKSKLEFVSLQVGFASKNLVQLPDMLGSTLRGTFGKALKKASCVMHHRNCEICMVKKHCTYFKIFESQNYGIAEMGIQNPPHPYVILPPLKNIYLQNELLYFRFTLFGNDISSIPYVVYAFQKMAEEGLGAKREKFELVQIKDAFSKNPIYFDGNLELENLTKRTLGDISQIYPKRAEKLLISFTTPLRILKDKKILKSIEKPILLENIKRRFKIMTMLYGKFDESDFSDLELLELEPIEHKYKRWKRYSNRQKSHINQDGFYAKWILYPNSAKNYYLLKALRSIHLGKSASFGLGAFRMREIGKA
ncbi:MAG: hypothetical protein N3A69_05040 [Leptospiraceae bacterium]|nr:hypothetical protein [Leptospiraceae bacterium]